MTADDDSTRAAAGGQGKSGSSTAPQGPPIRSRLRWLRNRNATSEPGSTS